MELKKWIKSHEGYSAFPYKCTEDRTTIGWGRNLQDNGISQEEANILFDNDLKRCVGELKQYDWYRYQPQNVQYALTDMCFNLGIKRLVGFKKMIEALIEKDYTRASIEALDSKWATQVGERAKDVAVMIRQG